MVQRYFIFTLNPGKMIQCDLCIFFLNGWLNHQQRIKVTHLIPLSFPTFCASPWFFMVYLRFSRVFHRLDVFEEHGWSQRLPARLRKEKTTLKVYGSKWVGSALLRKEITQWQCKNMFHANGLPWVSMVNGIFFSYSSTQNFFKTCLKWLTISPIIMEVGNHPKWKGN